MSSTESRLAAVERQLRFHRAVIAALLVALVALMGYGATEGVPDVIRARSFVVLNEKDQEVVNIGSEIVGGKLIVKSSDGKPAIVMFPIPVGGGMIAILDKNGIRRVGLSVVGLISGLTINDNNNDILLSISSVKKGLTWITIRGGGKFSIYNDNGYEVVRAYSNEKGDGSVIVGDRQGKGRTLTPR